MSAWIVKATDEFGDWLRDLRDERAQFRIAQRIERMRSGMLGDTKSVGGGIMEARIDHGPGYRLYFIRRGRQIIVLLCGGDKGSQTRDIARARAMATEMED